MLRKIISIRNVGRFRNSATAGNPELARYTLIVGTNGFGKTTLCAVLRSLKTGEPAHLLAHTIDDIAQDAETCLAEYLAAHGMEMSGDRRQIAHRPHVRLAGRQAGRSSSRPRARGLRPCPMYPRRVRGVPGARPSHHGLLRSAAAARRGPLARHARDRRPSRRFGRRVLRASGRAPDGAPWASLEDTTRTDRRRYSDGHPSSSALAISRRTTSGGIISPRPRQCRKVPERAQPAERA